MTTSESWSSECLRRAEGLARIGLLEYTENGLRPSRWSDGMFEIVEEQPTPDGSWDKSLVDYIHPEDLPHLQRTRTVSLPVGSEIIFDDTFRILTALGRTRTIRLQGRRSQHYADGKTVLALCHDVTEHARVARVLSLLSACNGALAVADHDEDLLDRMCQAAVQVGSYTYASYSRSALPDPQRLATVAFAGSDRWVGETLAERAAEAYRTRQQIVLAEGWENVSVPVRSSAVFLPVHVDGRLDGVLTLWASDEAAFCGEVLGHVQDLGVQLGLGLSRLRDMQRLSLMVNSTAEALAATVEVRDPYTAGHQQRAAELAVALAGAMGLDSETLRSVRLAALIHDLGKIGIPTDILSRPGALAPEEKALLRKHAEIGAGIARQYDWPCPLGDIIEQHHEAYDGSGYPHGLVGETILIEARIIAVADVYESLTHHRPYRPAHPAEVALAEVVRGSGTQFDPTVVSALCAVLDGGFQFSEALEGTASPGRR